MLRTVFKYNHSVAGPMARALVFPWKRTLWGSSGASNNSYPDNINTNPNGYLNSSQHSLFHTWTSPLLATLNQIKRGAGVPRRKRISMSPDLQHCPQRKGVVVRVMILKPKKPNSAQRKVCRVKLTNGHVVSAYIPGEGHNAQEHSIVYVRGGRCQDLPGVKYHLIRGAGDLSGVVNRVSSRSKYGAKKPTK